MRLIDAEYVLWKVQSEAFPQSVDFGQGRESVLEEIRKAPTVDADRPTGKWINDIRYSGWTCTKCNYHDGNATDNYCPNCGAYMRKETGNGN